MDRVHFDYEILVVLSISSYWHAVTAAATLLYYMKLIYGL